MLLLVILTARSLDRLMGLHSEAWAMSTVTHPAVAQIHGVESWRGRPFLVVEFLAGGTLEDRLRDGPLAPSQAVSVVARLADALAALHEKGCLHGDVKPSNIGFTAEGSPKLLDFGLAHSVDDAAMVGGTLPYLSPEVLTGRPAEAADDVWSLCVVLYEMVSGRHPFAGGAPEEVQRRIRRQRLAAGGPAASAAPAAAAAVSAFAASVLTAPRGGGGGRAPCPPSPPRWPRSPGPRRRNFLHPARPVLSCHTSQGTHGSRRRAFLPEAAPFNPLADEHHFTIPGVGGAMLTNTTDIGTAMLPVRRVTLPARTDVSPSATPPRAWPGRGRGLTGRGADPVGGCRP